MLTLQEQGHRFAKNSWEETCLRGDIQLCELSVPSSQLSRFLLTYLDSGLLKALCGHS